MPTCHAFILSLGIGLGAMGCSVEELEFDNPRGAEGEFKHKKCTYTQGYWKTHNIYAQQAHKQTPWPLSEDHVACGRTWYQWLIQPQAGGNHWLILAHQWIAAMLNQAQGAPVDEEVQAALSRGATLLDACVIDDADVEYAMELSETLDAFNNGLLSAPHCDSLKDD